MNNPSNRRALVGTVCGLLVGLLIGFFIWGFNSPQDSSQHSPAAVSTPLPHKRPMNSTEPTPKVNAATPAMHAETPPPADAIKLISGTENDEYDRIYACSTGYQPIDVAVGKVISPSAGTQFELSETRDGADYQSSVTAKVSLGAKYSLGGVIIVTAAHEHAPTLYPEFKLLVVLDAQGNATFTLQSSAYVENYYDAGISHLTFCVKQIG